MKKLLTILLLLVVLTSCEDNVRSENIIDESENVPQSYHDSTRWSNAQIFIEPKNTMYIKSDQDVYKIKEQPTGVWVWFAFVFFLAGGIIGHSIGENKS
jgi:hypothetical protein